MTLKTRKALSKADDARRLGIPILDENGLRNLVTS